MDTGTAIVALIIILIGIFPFVLINRKRKGAEKKLLKKFTELAQQHNCRISQYQLFSNAILGMDENTGMVFFLKNNNDKFTKQQINLADIEKCRIEIAVVSGNGEDTAAFDKVDLLFTYRDKKMPDSRIGVYNGATDGVSLSDEIMLTEKWATKLSAKIKTKKPATVNV